MWDPLCAELGASRFVLNMDGKDHARMRRETRDGFSRQLIESEIPEAVDVIRRTVATMPLHAPLPALPALLRLVGETTSAIVAQSSTGGLHGRRAPGAPGGRDARLPAHAPPTEDTPAAARAPPRGGIVGPLADEDTRLRQRPRKANAIDDMLALHRADPMFLPECDLPLTALLPLFAGVETVGSVGACMLYVVLKNPALRERAQAEADALFAAGTPDAAKNAQAGHPLPHHAGSAAHVQRRSRESSAG